MRSHGDRSLDTPPLRPRTSVRYPGRMLQELHVRDLALVDAACVRFGRGLNLLTGETGSGKSLIVDALGLSLGARASTDQVRQGADRARAEAFLDVASVPAAQASLEAMGHEAGESVVLARE